MPASSAAAPGPDQPDDAELLRRIRSGDSDAADLLHRRHWQAARRFAQTLTDPTTADDLAAEAFTRVLAALQDGNGPDRAVRPYLLATIRNLHTSEVRRSGRAVLVDDFAGREDETGAVSADGVEQRLESDLLREAFLALPPRWQTVLWHTTVEDDDHRAVAELLGILPNAVAALAHRAREGLRRSYLAAHVSAAPDEACRTTRQALPGYLRGRPGRRGTRAVESHLATCAGCAAVAEELAALNGNLGGLLAPAVLGTSGGTTYLAAVAPGPVASRAAEPTRPGARASRRAGLVAAVAVAMLCAAALASVPLLRPDRSMPEAAAPRVAAAAPSSAPAPSPRARRTAAPAPRPVTGREAPVAVPDALAPPTAAVPSVRPSDAPAPSATPEPSPTGRPSRAPDPVPAPLPAETPPALSRGYHADFGPHHHVEMLIRPTAKDTLLILTVERLTSYVVHGTAPYQALSCSAAGLTTDATVLTCPLDGGVVLAGLDLVVDGALRARAELVSRGSGTAVDAPALVFESD